MGKTNDSINYYDKNAEEFVSGTISVDMGALHSKFLAKIPEGGHILDAGCGSGRDSLHFIKSGYEVTAFDGSLEMVKRSSALTGLEVLNLTFEELDFNEEFDGVWACASVLHTPKSRMIPVIERLAQATKENGVIYLSFKHGNGEEVRKGRHFSNYTEEEFVQLIGHFPLLQILEMWTTGDVRPGREKEMWLNALVRRGRKCHRI